MRDPDRIDRILALVRKNWKRYPDLRFMQLVQHLYAGLNPGISEDWFYTEDDRLEEKLKDKG